MAKIDGGLRQLFRERLPGFDWTSIESGTTGGGIPDSNYCARYGIEGWIEHKQTGGHVVTLRPEQIGWIARRVRHGGRVWIAVRQHAPPGSRRAARDVLWLIPGRLSKEAKLMGLQWLDGVPGVLQWHNGPSAWDWRAVGAALTT